MERRLKRAKTGRRRAARPAGARSAAAKAAAKAAGRRVAESTRAVAASSVAKARDLRRSAIQALQPPGPLEMPHLSLLRAPALPMTTAAMGQEITVASYNVHRWTGLNGRARPDAARAGFVISEIEADVIALQEVLRPYEDADPLEILCESLGLHLAFAATRMHRRGELGNAILSRFPITSISVLDISLSRLERRGALAAQFNSPAGQLGVVATHLSLVDRLRHRQVQMLLEHPQLNCGPAVLVGDLNAWRKCKGTQSLEQNLHRHNNVEWPSTFPAAAPMLALDRVYAKGAEVLDVHVHDTPASRRASDHLPVLARIQLSKDD
ncbi:MAG: endonuclease/exonuclease/phosphatase family protein [Deltaproteobacteria bacterium]|nr:endonuclease/exonuclease/phosphatase family protein [Deltaproteobacteria bacterium]